MPRFYFHIVQANQERIEDLEGIELHDIESARREATRSARELLAERLKNGVPLGNDLFEITDEAGEMMLVFPFDSAVETEPPS